MHRRWRRLIGFAPLLAGTCCKRDRVPRTFSLDPDLVAPLRHCPPPAGGPDIGQWAHDSHARSANPASQSRPLAGRASAFVRAVTSTQAKVSGWATAMRRVQRLAHGAHWSDQYRLPLWLPGHTRHRLRGLVAVFEHLILTTLSAATNAPEGALNHPAKVGGKRSSRRRPCPREQAPPGGPAFHRFFARSSGSST
jgi:hypothetical protein